MEVESESREEVVTQQVEELQRDSKVAVVEGMHPLEEEQVLVEVAVMYPSEGELQVALQEEEQQGSGEKVPEVGNWEMQEVENREVED